MVRLTCTDMETCCRILVALPMPGETTGLNMRTGHEYVTVQDRELDISNNTPPRSPHQTASGYLS